MTNKTKEEFGSNLSNLKSECHQYQEEIFNTNHISTLLRIENDVMRERLGRLYDAMQSLSDIKTMQDKYEVLIQKTKNEEIAIREEMTALEMNKLDLQAKTGS